MAGLFAPIEPYDHGTLEVGEGNSVYWETSGNPAGQPAVVLHGGPGSGCSAGMRRFFDPSVYRIVLFDQRGCGRSTPYAGDPATNLSVNTTEHLLADIETLRRYLRIDRWLILGFSWGSTLGLAYAERYSDRVSHVVLAGVTTSRRAEIDWLYRGVAPLFPEEWRRFTDAVPAADRDGDLVEAYHRLLEAPDSAVRAKAAKHWSEWEWALTSIEPGDAPPCWSEPTFQLARSRIVTHYFRNDAWLDDAELLGHIGCLADIPVVLINGRFDAQSPLVTAWELSEALPGSDLVVVDGAGHSHADPGVSEAIVKATDRFAVIG